MTSRSARLASAVTLTVLVLGVAVCRLQVLTSDWAWDTGAWMYISRRLLEGASPYVDVWDNKLPPIFWIGMLYLKTGVPRLAMFVAEVGLTVWLAQVLAALVRRAGIARPWSLLLGGLFVCASMPVWEYPHRLETYALAAIAPAAWLLVDSLSRTDGRRGWRIFLAGALLALAAAIRPQHGLDAVLIGVWLLAFGGEGRLRRLVVYAAGGLALTGVLALAGWLGGYLSEMVRDAALGSLDYASGERTEAFTSLGAMAWELRLNIASTPLVWIAFGLGALVATACWRTMAAAPRAMAALAVVLFASQFASTFLAGHQLLHYHFPLGWSAALLLGVALGAADLRLATERTVRDGLAALALAILFVTTAFPEQDTFEGVLALVRPGRERRADRLESLVRANVPPDGPLYLLDDYAMAGVLSRLPNPAHDRWILFALQCAFFDPAHPPEGTTPYGVTSAERGRSFREHLERSPPPWLVRRSGREDELSTFVHARYEAVADNGEFTVWRLRGG